MTTESPPTKVLVANDNKINQKIFSKYFRLVGHDIEIVSDGREAFETYKRNPGSYRGILMKTAMPVMNGMESTRLIREFERERNLEPYSIVWTVACVLSTRKDLVQKYAVNDTLRWPAKMGEFVRILNRAGIPTALPERRANHENRVGAILNPPKATQPVYGRKLL
ncbi:Histidine protein kinase NIK1 [Colletotrichum shisoi]|uniref:Histidine protein kinase NIK1 n=1 Tax=Colletotrichum shisoi TaxID=2078593 RepID=A0A5Q4BHI8_9PEZI|nr:Histidine protein kinase NIK1 [Colletotrichum shisoi]